MSLFLGALPYFLLAFVLSLFLTPIARTIGLKLQIYALENERTVHHGKIVRFGGMAVYIAFLISMAVFMKADYILNAILVGGLIIFLAGVIDDMYDMPALLKLFFQMLAAVYVLYFGNLELGTINIGSLSIDFKWFSYVV